MISFLSFRSSKIKEFDLLPYNVLNSSLKKNAFNIYYFESAAVLVSLGLPDVSGLFLSTSAYLQRDT